MDDFVVVVGVAVIVGAAVVDVVACGASARSTVSWPVKTGSAMSLFPVTTGAESSRADGRVSCQSVVL